MSEGTKSGLQLRHTGGVAPVPAEGGMKGENSSHWPPETKHHGNEKEIRLTHSTLMLHFLIQNFICYPREAHGRAPRFQNKPWFHILVSGQL